MEIWWLHLLVFVFGYTTCKTFYFVRANRISLSLIKLAHVIYLSAVVKSIETLSHARYVAKMNDIEACQTNDVFDNEINLLKENSVTYLLQLHPKFYRDILKFNDWESCMRYLNLNKDAVFKIWKKQ